MKTRLIVLAVVFTTGTYVCHAALQGTGVKPVYGPTNPTPDQAEKMDIQRFGSVIGLVPEKEQYYRELHAKVWPEIVGQLKNSNIQNYSIFISELEGKKYLFSYFEYVGDDFKGDMAKISEHPKTKEWWKETDPCQKRLPGTPKGDQWKGLEMVFHMQ